MSSQTKFKNSVEVEGNLMNKRVVLTDLVARMNEEKKKEKKANLILSVAAVSAVTAFGIILTL
tara:strand:- start:1025 stop:1213 length:189 start_codon:yes stop_codon:yes gene_type:complete